MRTRSGLPLWWEAWLIYSKVLRAVASSEVGHKTTFEETFIPSGRGTPPKQAVLWVSCGPVQFLFPLNTHCPSPAGFTAAQPGEGGSPLTCSLHLTCELSRGQHRNHPQGYSAGIWFVVVQCILRFQGKNWAAGAELSDYPMNSRFPFVNLPLAVEWAPLWLSNAPVPRAPRPLLPPSPNAKYHRNPPRTQAGVRAKASGG